MLGNYRPLAMGSLSPTGLARWEKRWYLARDPIPTKCPRFQSTTTHWKRNPAMYKEVDAGWWRIFFFDGISRTCWIFERLCECAQYAKPPILGILSVFRVYKVSCSYHVILPPLASLPLSYPPRPFDLGPLALVQTPVLLVFLDLGSLALGSLALGHTPVLLVFLLAGSWYGSFS